jgi:alkylhydroperoxidase family enzyme
MSLGDCPARLVTDYVRVVPLDDETNSNPPASVAWITTIHEREADGLLRELYEREWDRKHNLVDNILKVHSLHPETLRAHIDLYRTVMYGPSKVSRAEREMIGVVVSSINKCHY